MAFLGRQGVTAPLTSADIPDGSVTAAKIATDTIAAGDVAPNAITASELADDAVDTNAILNDAVTNSKIGASAVGTTEMAASVIGVKPHIIPGVLYPAVAGKLMDGSTSHSGAYGTAQADGFSYYYTDIKGSKPIKDPRIGAHFGSQRHKFRSMQLLEQESATHGKEVHSIDGRNWLRIVEGNATQWYLANGSHGPNLSANTDATGMFLEVTGYFNDINLIGQTTTDRVNDVDITVNGDSGSRVDGGTTFDTTAGGPLFSRYVDSGSVINLGALTALGSSTLKAELGTTPAINTVKMEYMASGFYDRIGGIELIAQDTTSTATKSKIQIPAQNVVSYGKKFAVSATAQHYDPFNGFTNSTSLHSAFVDTATSLGLSTPIALHGAPWAISGSNNIRPYNGGRVIKWIASDGTIKTSVNIMPPNAQNTLGTVAGTTEVTTPSATNATATPIFSDDAIDFSLAEVAKKFHWREYGNGNANAGSVTGSTGGSWKDFSMLNGGTATDCAYCMDDGLTLVSGKEVIWGGGGNVVLGHGDEDGCYLTFIGTGLSFVNTDDGAGTYHIAQNVPYGTHIVGFHRSGTSDPDILFDGVDLSADLNNYSEWSEIIFHQPKMPPIPEDAVVIADYMLMADFVPQTASGAQYISKGVRSQNVSRDVFYDEADGDSFTFYQDVNSAGGFAIKLSGTADNDTSMTMRIPSFATNYVHRGYQNDTYAKLFIDTTDNDSSATKDNTAGYGSYAHLTSNLVLGVYKFGANAASGYNGYSSGFDIATPIHTSSHYQPFETPFLHELVGGDRNMEQTNLVVTPDGKTWDEVTRDTSYLGDIVLSTGTDTDTAWDNSIIFDDWRGSGTAAIYQQFFNKDWSIAYDRIVCLKDGWYEVSATLAMQNVGGYFALFLNGNGTTNNRFVVMRASSGTINQESHSFSKSWHFKRGDFLVPRGEFGGDSSAYNFFQIKRL